MIHRRVGRAYCVRLTSIHSTLDNINFFFSFVFNIHVVFYFLFVFIVSSFDFVALILGRVRFRSSVLINFQRHLVYSFLKTLLPHFTLCFCVRLAETETVTIQVAFKLNSGVNNLFLNNIIAQKSVETATGVH